MEQQPIQPEEQPVTSPEMSNQTHTEDPAGTPVGPMIGAIIVIGLLLLGGLYFWGTSLSEAPEEPPYILGEEADEGDSTAFPEQGSSDESSVIQGDTENTDMAQFEAEMNQDLQIFEGEF